VKCCPSPQDNYLYYKSTENQTTIPDPAENQAAKQLSLPEPMGKRPGLVLQNDLRNDSKLNTVIVAAITSTIKFGELPGSIF